MKMILKSGTIFSQCAKPLLAALAVTTLCLVGCLKHIDIADINRDPGRYAGQEITITGHASDSFGALGNGVFQVDDGTGHIWVFSQNYGIPGNGAKVTVTGRVQQGFSFGGRSFGIILYQTQTRD